MKATTVETKKTGTARYEDFLEPDVNEGSPRAVTVAIFHKERLKIC
jgi:hypothetical protein